MMYPQNPKPVHDRVDDIFKMFDQCKEDAQRHLAYILNTVAQLHPEVGITCSCSHVQYIPVQSVMFCLPV